MVDKNFYDELHPGAEIAKRVREELMGNHLSAPYALTAGKSKEIEKFAEDMGLSFVLAKSDREP